MSDLSASEIRNRPFRDCVQNPATIHELCREEVYIPNYASCCLYDAIYGTHKADEFIQEGAGI